MHDPYFHPIPHVRRFERLQTWTAALVSLLLVSFFIGFFVAHGWMLFQSWGFESDTARMIVKSISAMIGFGILSSLWLLLRITRPGEWLERYTVIALREFNRH